MSLYHMVLGQNPLAIEWLRMLALHPGALGRWRDAWLEDREDKLVIVLLTRCGGGNRREYEHVFDELEGHPQYIDNQDDPYDSTYATITFDVPPEFQGHIDGLLEELGADKRNIVVDNRSLQERFESAMKRMNQASAAKSN